MIGALLGTLLLCAPGAMAQDDGDAASLFATDGDGTDALRALEGADPLAARRIAIAALRRDPDDFRAHYVIGAVFYQEEANLPRARYHLQQADALYMANRERLDSEAWRAHWSVLRTLTWVASDMEDSATYYATMDRYNAMYDPDLVAERAWRLMKDERLAEARAVAEAALDAEDAWQMTLGGNTLCALEGMDRNRSTSLEVCVDVLERTRAAGFDITVDAYNAASSAMANLEHRRAVELLTMATRGEEGGSTNPWTLLTRLQLLQGNGREAAQAAVALQRWRHRQLPTDRAQTRANADATVALLLLAAGRAEQGMRAIDRALLRPDRRAQTTSTAAATLGTHTVFRLALRRVARERAAEQRTTASLPTRLTAWAASWLPDTAEAHDRAVLTGVLAEPAVLGWSLAAYYERGLDLPSWLLGELVYVVGPGVVRAALREQRALEPLAAIHAVYDAVETEAAWATGASDTVALATKALDALPPTEALLRARVAALGADHAWRYGQPDVALPWYELALQLDPGVFRRLSLRLPVRLSVQGGPAARQAGSALGRSPRFAVGRAGLELHVADDRICLASAYGNRLHCAPAPSPDDAEDPVIAWIDAFHTGAFSLPFELDRLDMRSLDGTNAWSKADRQQALDRVLDAL